MIKKLSFLIGLVALGLVIWFAFALWTGIYSVYSYPPNSSEYAEGATLVVSRDPGEPMWNSPDAPPPGRPNQPRKTRGNGFGPAPKPTRPIANRTILELPYIEWAYKKSLEREESGP
jgi:hypothetical protein